MAARFRFRLQTVLRLRELAEREARRQVGVKQAEIAQLDQQNLQTNNEIRQRQRLLTQAQSRAQLDLADLSQGRTWIARLRQAIWQRELVKAEKQKELDVLSDKWRETRKQLKIIEKLRERRAAAHRKAATKKETLELEETARRLHQSVYADDGAPGAPAIEQRLSSWIGTRRAK